MAVFAVFASLLFHFLILSAYGAILVGEHPSRSIVDAVEDKLGIFSLLILGQASLGEFALPILGIPLGISLYGAWLTLREVRLEPALIALGVSTLTASFGPILAYHVF
ncbi:hypothetical protein JDY09_07420 [Thermoleophilum album]|uniref:hypothetical protein n=1 Tax=Thermoleophilum album TaxID=29539 RepID=UPI00237CC19D|nr:hypothetical protein [Thermoleophilum album]WDT93211.1 hypothetical protein JDY09_07420 [Thermoleophilum album]